MQLKIISTQQIFDKRFRYFKRKDKKEQFSNLNKYAQNCNKTDMWSTLKKLNNPPSSRAALEIVRADESISRKYWKDGMQIFPTIKENPEMVFNVQFCAEELRKKSEFEN